MTLEGRGAVVTGGGRGIGAAVARALSQEGVRVMVAARNRAQIDAVAAELTSAGAEAHAVECDVTSLDSVGALAKAARDRLGSVDILVNNAGVGHSAPLAKLSLADWNRTLSVNATGPLLCTQAFVPDMMERGWGRVINVASVAGLTGARYIAAYSASKHALIGFTRSMADELRASGITVNAVCPGFVDTEMTTESIARISSKTGLAPDEAREAMMGTTAQQRLISPEEVAAMVVWLSGDAARSVSGQAIVIDDGGLRS